MKLDATCETCGRRFALAQILPEPTGTGGRCPFCGHNFARHYVSVLPGLLEDAERGADFLAGAIERVQGLRPGFRIDLEGLMSKLREELGSMENESA